MQIRDDRCGVAGEGLSWRCDEHCFERPAAHAGFGKLCVVIGDDVFDAELAAEALLRVFEEIDRARKLIARGKKLRTIGEGPAVILDMRELDARCGGVFGDGEHCIKLIEIAAMYYEVEREADAARPQPIEYAELLWVRLGAGN